jgi:hypothetical protein
MHACSERIAAAPPLTRSVPEGVRAAEGCRQRLAQARGAVVQPHERVVQRAAAGAAPHHSGLALAWRGGEVGRGAAWWAAAAAGPRPEGFDEAAERVELVRSWVPQASGRGRVTHLIGDPQGHHAQRRPPRRGRGLLRRLHTNSSSSVEGDGGALVDTLGGGRGRGGGGEACQGAVCACGCAEGRRAGAVGRTSQAQLRHSTTVRQTSSGSCSHHLQAGRGRLKPLSTAACAETGCWAYGPARCSLAALQSPVQTVVASKSGLPRMWVDLWERDLVAGYGHHVLQVRFKDVHACALRPLVKSSHAGCERLIHGAGLRSRRHSCPGLLGSSLLPASADADA